jgi:hypothetical protein
MRFRIYYGDGSTYDGSPENAPALNVQAVAWEHPEHGRQLMYGKDYYWWLDDEWYLGDLFGMWDYLAHTDGWVKVLFGRSIPVADFKALIERATTETW